MNYKKKMLSFLDVSLKDGLEEHKEMGYPTKALEKAFDLTYDILNKRFENELKQYNQDETKAYDEFVTRKNLDYLKVYIEEFLLLDKEESQIDFYKAVRKHMRDLLNAFYTQVL